jgi:hypothetical protein
MIAQEKLPDENEEASGRSIFPVLTGLFMNTKKCDETFFIAWANFLRRGVEIFCGRKTLRSLRAACA